MGAISSVLPISSFWNSYRPFDVLPDELLVLIFEHVGEFVIGRPPIACLRVSKRWRAIAQTYLCTAGNLFVGSRTIALSRSAPLYLDLDVAGDATYPGTSCPPWRAVHVAKVVTENMHRVARLQLRFRPQQTSLFSEVLSSTAPILDELVLMCGGVVDLELDAPRLRRLEVDRMQLRHWDLASFPLLSELHLRSGYINLNNLHGIISSSERLDTFITDQVSFNPCWLSPDGMTADWSHAFLKHLVITHPYGTEHSDTLANLLGNLRLSDLEHLQHTFDPFTEYAVTMSSAVDTLFTVLKPTCIRVWRTNDKIWHVELDDPRRAISFPQRVGGPMISTILESAARFVRRIVADDAFCNQIVRRRAQDELPEFQYFEELEFIRDAKGRLPAQANEALDACLEASQRE
ncbi:hypothetical protein EXIGLDRAFT_701024 [Exidia glandulosa HHB12029]|uniref:F-box domain-containing protein n=1 Tax=Exidia glandulosa HHB12029 TaxID=1314781 RepID=A0A165D6A3_EXIGL|nr:hypothetical protein EXIGLDRAFT_701024 [Exidia glandulosa HHB12029]